MVARALREGRRTGKRPAARGIALAAVCALVWAICLLTPLPAAAAEGGEAAPYPSPWASAAAEARELADRVLRRESGDLLLDGARQRALGREIKRVLATIRRHDPEMADISARPLYVPGTLLLELEGALLDAVAARWGWEAYSTVPPTGHAAFDALNARLGLRAVQPFPALDSVALTLDERVNVEAAMLIFSKIEGVFSAEPDHLLGDGSDIEATPMPRSWLVVFRKAWGDCAAGCIREEFSFFEVAGERVERYESARARGMGPFAELLALRGWR